MPWCPECGRKYNEGFTECTDCSFKNKPVKLIDKPTDSEHIKIPTAVNIKWVIADILKQIFKWLIKIIKVGYFIASVGFMCVFLFNTITYTYTNNEANDSIVFLYKKYAIIPTVVSIVLMIFMFLFNLLGWRKKIIIKNKKFSYSFLNILYYFIIYILPLIWFLHIIFIGANGVINYIFQKGVFYD